MNGHEGYVVECDSYDLTINHFGHYWYTRPDKSGMYDTLVYLVDYVRSWERSHALLF